MITQAIPLSSGGPAAPAGAPRDAALRDATEAENGLPDTLRARIFYLAEFTVHHSSRVLRGAARLQPLIDVDRAVMRGLAPVAAPVGAAS